MTVKYIQNITRSGTFNSTSADGGNFTIQMTSPVSDVPGFVTYSYVGVVCEIYIACCGTNQGTGSNSGGGEAIVAYEWNGSNWKSSSLLSANYSGSISSISSPSVSSSSTLSAILNLICYY